MKVPNNKSSHNKRHFKSFRISFSPLLNTRMPTGIIYSATPPRPVKRGVTRSMRPAAGLRGPPRSTVAVRAAVRAAVVALA